MPSHRRTFRVFAAALMASALSVGVSGAQASAHPISTTAVLLDLGREAVTAEVELPVDRLAVAFDEPLTGATVVQPGTLSTIREYVREHLSASDPSAGAWTTTVGAGRVEAIDGVDHLVLDAVLTPPTGTVGDFTLHYDAILERILSHRVFVSARAGDTGAYTTLAVLSWQSRSVLVSRTGAGVETGFLTSLRLGLHHIRTGSDHLLFLMMLLLPAPLAVRGSRWVRRDDLVRAGRRTVHVVTAFAVGHSITLALAAVGLLQLPSRAVESGIALSVLVSAVHAVRPLLRGGEVVLAGGFGLLHGLAFAGLVDELGLGRGGLVVDLLGFNLGIEVAQLLVVALVMPSLFLFSRTGGYQVVRAVAGAFGAVLAAAWLAERVGLLARNPLGPVADVLVDHPLPAAAALAAAAALTWTVGRRRRAGAPADPGTDGTSPPAGQQHPPAERAAASA